MFYYLLLFVPMIIAEIWLSVWYKKESKKLEKRLNDMFDQAHSNQIKNH